MIPVVVGLTVLGIFALVCVVAAVKMRRASEENFLPMSDAEFLARCPPGTSPEVALKVRRIVADTLAVKYDLVHPATRFVEDIAAD